MYSNLSKYRIIILSVVLIFSLSCAIENNETRVVLYGDSRPNDYRHLKVIDAILEVSPDVVFHVGDLVNDGNIPGLWGKFNEATRELREIAKFYPTAGNHEKESIYYYDNFELPNNEKWYSVKVDSVYYILLNSNLDLQIGSEQYNWLVQELQNISNEIKFTVVMFHHPLIASGPHIPDANMIAGGLTPLFEKNGVDIVFAGHNHLYERSYRNGIYYIVSGGGGTALHFISDSSLNPFSEKIISTFHFCVLRLQNDKLNVDVFDVDLNRIDYFSVN